VFITVPEVASIGLIFLGVQVPANMLNVQVPANMLKVEIFKRSSTKTCVQESRIH